MWYFQARDVKTLSFYNELYMLNTPSLIVVFLRAQTVVFFDDFVKYRSHQRWNVDLPSIFTMIYEGPQTVVKMHTKNTSILQ